MIRLATTAVQLGIFAPLWFFAPALRAALRDLTRPQED